MTNAAHDHAHGGHAHGGRAANSLALLADAGHMLSDVAALARSLFAMWAAQRPPTPRRSYGYSRTEILAALVNGETLVAVSIYIFVEAYRRLREPPEVQGALMMGIAVGGLAINLIGLWILNAGRSESLNIRGARLHVATDALGSVGAILGGALIGLFGWYWADPVVSVVIGVLVIHSSWALLKATVAVLMEGAPGKTSTRTRCGVRWRGYPGSQRCTTSTSGRSRVGWSRSRRTSPRRMAVREQCRLGAAGRARRDRPGDQRSQGPPAPRHRRAPAAPDPVLARGPHRRRVQGARRTGALVRRPRRAARRRGILGGVRRRDAEPASLRAAPDSPLRRAIPGAVEQREFEYVRHGTVDILTLLAVRSGRLDVRCLEVNDAAHYVPALERFRRAHRDDVCGIFLFHDGGPGHTAALKADYFVSCDGWWRPRLTPAHASWLNQSELLNNAFDRRDRRRGSRASRAAYATHVSAARRTYNRRYAHPFEWTWTSQQMRRWYNGHVSH